METHGKPWKTMENHRPPMENHGKPMENHGKLGQPMDIFIGKSWKIEFKLSHHPILWDIYGKFRGQKIAKWSEQLGETPVKSENGLHGAIHSNSHGFQSPTWPPRPPQEFCLGNMQNCQGPWRRSAAPARAKFPLGQSRGEITGRSYQWIMMTNW